jgi:hypothetical protein
MTRSAVRVESSCPSEVEVYMKRLPKTHNSLLIRTDFSDDAAWDALCEDVQARSEGGFQAHVDCINDPVYDGLTVEQLVVLNPKGTDRSFAFIVDRIALMNSEKLILVVDLYDVPGRTFRVIPREIWSVENNLSIANLDFSEFADNTDADGVYRGLPRTNGRSS